MGKTSLGKKIIILVVLLALPGFLYYLLQEKGRNRYHPLGIFGPKKVASTFHTVRGKSVADTIYHVIDKFTLTNQLGHSYTFPAEDNKIYVVNFFFTGCESSCRNMNAEVEKVVSAYKKNNYMRFLSITVDPKKDTPEVLRKYASHYHATAGKWDFLTGEQNSIFKIAQTQFLVDALKDSSKADNYIHSPMLILIDPQRRIRGYYNSLEEIQINRLIDEIKVLIAEELRKYKTGDN